MLLESLIVYSCIVGKGCEESAHAYYLGSPSLQEMAHTSEEKIQKVAGKNALLYILPIATLAVADKASVKITRHISVDVAKQESLIKLSWSY